MLGQLQDCFIEDTTIPTAPHPTENLLVESDLLFFYAVLLAHDVW